ncbi:MAG: PEP-CTERM sorting domain-containing protein [Stellaceae bacterium]
MITPVSPPPPPALPEPGALSLFGTALAGLGFVRWRRRAGPPRADGSDGEEDGVGPAVP